MARGHGIVRQHPQTRAEMLMPRADYEALQRRRQARWDRGQATDEDTVDSNDDEEDEAEGGDEELEEELEERAPPEEPLELQARKSAVAMFRRTLLFSQGAATAL